MSRTFDVIVVGLGVMGAAACHHLARRGVRVLGLDRFGVPNGHGSSHGDTRIIRRCYFEHPDYVPLLHRAYDQWRALEDESGRRLLHLTGGLFSGPANGSFMEGNLLAAQTHAVPHEPLDRDALRRRFSQFEVPEDHVAIFEPGAGFILAEQAVSAFAETAQRNGAELHGCEALTDWEAGPAGVTVRTAAATYHADRLVICGGPWAQGLLGALSIRVAVTRHPLAWVWPRRPERFEMDVFPVFAIDDPGGLCYGFPMGSGACSTRAGLKVARHGAGQITDPDTVDRGISEADELAVREALRRFIPDADGPLLAMTVCMYTDSPDGHFIIDRHPEHEQVVFAAGFSGHGFKFASVIGEVLADLTVEGSTRQPVQFLRLDRF